MVVMVLLSIAGRAMPQPQYLKSYDPDAFDGRGDVEGTANLDDAMKFPDAGVALKLWKKTSTVRPTRPDGKPNRPLSAFTVSIENV